MVRKPLTELEGVIAGIIWSREPCSAYVVLARFKSSPTWGWSSSAGAIYPAIKRLRARGLVAADSGRGTGPEQLSLSADGQDALQAWLGDVHEEMGSAGIDPIRTRVNYIAALSPTQRLEFVDRSMSLTGAKLESAKASAIDSEARANWTLQATTRGIVYQLEARLRWLKELRQTLAHPGINGPRT